MDEVTGDLRQGHHPGLTYVTESFFGCVPPESGLASFVPSKDLPRGHGIARVPTAMACIDALAALIFAISRAENGIFRECLGEM